MARGGYLCLYWPVVYVVGEVCHIVSRVVLSYLWGLLGHTASQIAPRTFHICNNDRKFTLTAHNGEHTHTQKYPQCMAISCYPHSEWNYSRYEQHTACFVVAVVVAFAATAILVFRNTISKGVDVLSDRSVNPREAGFPWVLQTGSPQHHVCFLHPASSLPAYQMPPSWIYTLSFWFVMRSIFICITNGKKCSPSAW